MARNASTPSVSCSCSKFDAFVRRSPI